MSSTDPKTPQSGKQNLNPRPMARARGMKKAPGFTTPRVIPDPEPESGLAVERRENVQGSNWTWSGTKKRPSPEPQKARPAPKAPQLSRPRTVKPARKTVKAPSPAKTQPMAKAPSPAVPSPMILTPQGQYQAGRSPMVVSPQVPSCLVRERVVKRPEVMAYVWGSPMQWNATDEIPAEDPLHQSMAQEVLAEKPQEGVDELTLILLMGIWLQNTVTADDLGNYHGKTWKKVSDGQFVATEKAKVVAAEFDKNPDSFLMIAANIGAAWKDPSCMFEGHRFNLMAEILEYAGWEGTDLHAAKPPPPPPENPKPKPPPKPAPKSILKSSATPPQPKKSVGFMEIHCVNDEERYVDTNGNVYPYAWLSADGPPLKPDEERGPFGKSKSRSRSRTGAPAVKKPVDENVLEFGRLLDQQRLLDNVQQLTRSAASELPNVKNDPTRHEPTEVILYGFPQNFHWAAIDRYEKAFGRICEDYARDPPVEFTKFPNSIRKAAPFTHGPKTLQESFSTMRYAGGDCWIKVTFERAEFARRAVEAVYPIEVHGGRVMCSYWKGVEPQDKPIPVSEVGSVPPIPGSWTSVEATNNDLNGSGADNPKDASHTSSTASSATATGIGENSSQPYRRRMSPRRSSRSTSKSPDRERVLNLRNSPSSRVERQPRRYLLDMPRREMRPAEEAFAPLPSRSQRIMANLPAWLTTDVVGQIVPRLATGEFDWDNATLYWKLCYLIDKYFGTDICGLRDDQ